MSKIKVAIIGIGLIGGSIGLAVKDRFKEDVYIWGLDSKTETLNIAMQRGAVDHATQDYETAVKDADVIFLSTPVLQIVPMIEKILPFLKPGAILTDTGSTKQYIWEKLREILPGNIYYVAGHPMAGKEYSGIAVADKNLFHNKCYVIVEDTGAPQGAIATVCELVEATGANITTMDIAQHDRCASVISHVPHVTAAALVTLLNNSQNDIEANLKLAGGGFKDTTRIASSNADMWADICISNPEAIINNLQELKQIIDNVIVDIGNGNRQNIHDYFYAAKQRRDNILDKTNHLFEI
ncbi:MAG: tyrA [Firmicutes bacterium]|nr:tyrA [Bacillota bacterium]